MEAARKESLFSNFQGSFTKDKNKKNTTKNNPAPKNKQ